MYISLKIGNNTKLGVDNMSRQDEINFVANMVQKICEEANVLILPGERNGQRCIVIHDLFDGKDYYLLRGKDY